MSGRRVRRALVVAGSSLAVLISASVSSAACVARPMTVGQALKTGQTTIKLPPFLHATLVCSTVRGLRGAVGGTGARGKIGVTGAVGASGLQGLIGIPGLQGPTGATGPIGPAGTVGAPGAQGAAGQQGIPGTPGTPATKGLAEYASISNEGAQTVALEGAVTFDTDRFATAGITHLTNASTITLVSAGDYKISYAFEAAVPAQMSLFLNNVLVPHSTIGSGDGLQWTPGIAVVTAGAASVLTLRNHTTSSGAVALETLAGGTATTENASIVIEKLG